MSVFYYVFCVVVFFAGALLITFLTDKNSAAAAGLIRLTAVLALVVKGGEFLFMNIVGIPSIPIEFSAQTYFFFSAVALLDKRKKLYPLASFCGIFAGIVYLTGALIKPASFVSGADFQFQIVTGIIAHSAIFLGGMMMLKSARFNGGAFLQMLLGGSLFLVYALSVYYGVGVRGEVYLVRMLNGTLLDPATPVYASKGIMYSIVYYAAAVSIFCLSMFGLVLINKALYKKRSF